MNKRKAQIAEYLPDNIRQIVDKLSSSEFDKLEELRIRLGRPIMAKDRSGDRQLNGDAARGLPYIATRADINDTIQLMSDNSLYAFMEEIKKGFITIRGGHRVGLCGRVVMHNNVLMNITDISGINIRIVKEILGAADRVFTYIKGDCIANTLIISPPGCGKTTILRDIARKLGTSVNVGIVDERSEIAGSYRGEAQLNVGIMTDVLDMCPKHIGIGMMLRSMAPNVILTDEIATEADVRSVCEAINSGVAVITSAHGATVEEVSEKMPDTVNLFDTIIVLSKRQGAGTIERVIHK